MVLRLPQYVLINSDSNLWVGVLFPDFPTACKHRPQFLWANGRHWFARHSSESGRLTIVCVKCTAGSLLCMFGQSALPLTASITASCRVRASSAGTRIANIFAPRTHFQSLFLCNRLGKLEPHCGKQAFGRETDALISLMRPHEPRHNRKRWVRYEPINLCLSTSVSPPLTAISVSPCCSPGLSCGGAFPDGHYLIAALTVLSNLDADCCVPIAIRFVGSIAF